jgi:predicted HTH domain antitoxin
MSEKTVSIPIPASLPHVLRMSDEEFAQEAREVLAAKLYEMGRVSLGIAAEISGMGRLEFLALLGRYGVPAINLKGDDADAEVEAARELAEL